MRLLWRGLVGDGTWHPDLVQAARVALAAGLAWIVVLPFGGVADAFPYYAPLGAVVVVSSSLVGTIRESVGRTLAILLGAALALAVSPFPGPAAAWLVAVVFAGSLVATRSWFSGLDAWVPLSAIYVLIIGGSHPWHFAMAYVGLVSLGALVGVALNALIPPLPLGAAEHAVAHLRGVVADQLERLADGLEQDEAPDEETWRAREVAMDPAFQQMRGTVLRLQDARRANWLARSPRLRVAQHQYDTAIRLRRMVVLVEDTRSLLFAYEDHRRHTALGPRLRPRAAEALRAVADVVGRRDPDEEQRAQADAAVDRFLQEIGAAPTTPAAGDLAPRSLVLHLRRMIALTGD